MHGALSIKLELFMPCKKGLHGGLCRITPVHGDILLLTFISYVAGVKKECPTAKTELRKEEGSSSAPSTSGTIKSEDQIRHAPDGAKLAAEDISNMKQAPSGTGQAIKAERLEEENGRLKTGVRKEDTVAKQRTKFEPSAAKLPPKGESVAKTITDATHD